MGTQMAVGDRFEFTDPDGDALVVRSDRAGVFIDMNEGSIAFDAGGLRILIERLQYVARRFDQSG